MPCMLTYQCTLDNQCFISIPAQAHRFAGHPFLYAFFTEVPHHGTVLCPFLNLACGYNSEGDIDFTLIEPFTGTLILYSLQNRP